MYQSAEALQRVYAMDSLEAARTAQARSRRRRTPCATKIYVIELNRSQNWKHLWGRDPGRGWNGMTLLGCDCAATLCSRSTKHCEGHRHMAVANDLLAHSARCDSNQPCGIAPLMVFTALSDRGKRDADCSFQDRAGPASESSRFHLRLKRPKETKMETKAVGQHGN